MVKNRKISTKDWQRVGTYIKAELGKREQDSNRKKHERIWKEVDRQINMEPMERIARDPDSPVTDWHSALELGELSRASEVLSADIRRLTFPPHWFDPHVYLVSDMDAETGAPATSENEQKEANDRLRAFMSQQHVDFSLKDRADLSVKEALHHGSYVAEVQFETMMAVKPGGNVAFSGSPAWVAHSMWNCFPDLTPANVGVNMFYTGSMIIVEYKDRDQLRRTTGPHYMNLNKIRSDENKKQIKCIKYFGDITITRGNGDDIYLPNCQVRVTEEGIVYYYRENPMPFPEIIYNGWERLDVRDPYYVSPLIKMSPTQKFGSEMANKFIDSIDLVNEKPIVYDATDESFIGTGGPVIAPGAKTPTRGTATYKEINVGNPDATLAGLKFSLVELQKGTSVDAVRSGMSSGAEQTATEVERVHQGAQIRTLNFVDKHESNGLRPFLYMQHELNKEKLGNYAFYNSGVGVPDFDVMTKNELPLHATFEVVGSRGIVDDAQRKQETLAVTKFASEIPAMEKRLNYGEILKELFGDAGNKNPERFLLQEQNNSQVEDVQQQAQTVIQQLQDELTKFQYQQQAFNAERKSYQAEVDRQQLISEKLRLIIEAISQRDKTKDAIKTAFNESGLGSIDPEAGA